ncbi:hypothetical protein Hte_001040 [Hypoxylon texense]
MDPGTWTTLPQELKAQVCEFLYGTHLSSLVNLAITNKDNYDVAALFLFRTIKIFVNERDRSQPNLQKYVRHLECFEAKKHVRRLVIYGPGWSSPVRTGFGYERPSFIRTLAYIPDPERENNENPLRTRFDKLTGVDVWDNIIHSAFVPDTSPVGTAYQLNERWRPLANLIRQLPMLGDVIYQCSTQFPPCLLAALHERQSGWPRCRLHIDAFKLRCLSSEPLALDPHELMLIASPCLHSINIRMGRRALHNSLHWLHDSHLGLVFRLVRGIAPNIKEVHVAGTNGTRNPSLRGGLAALLEKGLQGKGSLSCLQLYGGTSNGINGQDIDSWGTHTDFTVLRTLKLDSEVAQSALETLVNKHGFPSLEVLSIRLRPPTWDIVPQDMSAYFLLVKRFLQNLPRLITLKITNWMNGISLDRALGSSLRILWLEPVRSSYGLTPQHVAQIRERCPLLKDLTVVVRRSKGDLLERALYRELGTLPKLQHLSLKMDPSRPDYSFPTAWNWSEDESFDDFDREPLEPDTDSHVHDLWFERKGHVRDVFINSAIDETLTLAIFKAISETKERNNLVPLEKLEIRLTDAYYYPHPTSWVRCELETYIAMLGRSWQVVRIPRGSSGQVLLAQEIDKGERERAIRRSEENVRAIKRPMHPNPPLDLETIFRRIWPQRREGSTLEEDWRSWPLSTPTPVASSSY